LQTGGYFYIQWRSSLRKFPSVTITLHDNNNKSNIIADNIKNTGLYNWKIPSAFLSGSNYVIKVTGVGETTLEGLSAPFVILNKSDKYEPDDSISMATEITTDGVVQTHTLSYPGDVDWYKFNAVAGTSYLLQTNGSLEKLVYLNINDNSLLKPYNSCPNIIWTCLTTGMYFFKVYTKENNFTNYTDTLPYTIFVKQADTLLSILNPKNGDIYTAGQQVSIKWIATSYVPSITLELLRNDSAIASVANIISGSPYSWTLPLSLTASSNYQLRIYSKSNTSIKSEPIVLSIVPVKYSMSVATTDISKKYGTGDTATIYWNCTGLSGNYELRNFKLDLYKDSIKASEIKSYIYDTVGTRSWKIPYDLSPSDHYRIKVSCMKDTTASCFSEEFSITTTLSSFKIISPSSGDKITNDSTVKIKWSILGKPVSTFNIDLYDSTKYINSVQTSISTSISELSWLVPSSIPTGVYRLKFTARSDSTVYAWSGFFSFTHVPASYTFTSPAAGSTFTGVCNVAWQSNGPVGTRVNIYLLNDTVMQKGGYYGYNYTGNSGKYDIRIPVTTPQGDRFRIKLTATNDTTIQSFSDYFTIVPVAKTISVTYPPADTVLMGGKSTYITWTHTGVADGYSQNYAFKIDLYDSTTFVSSLFQFVEYTVQACYWVVPKTVATKSTYRIKITSLLFPDVFSFSGYFTIAN
jgi:hypothetical protein